VCIIGWDDDFDGKNFVQNREGEYPKNGAWLVMNSWGSQTDAADESDPDYGEFGNKDKNGKRDGTFWLSYYDITIDEVETYDFITERLENAVTIVHQYDYLPYDRSGMTCSAEPGKKVRTANVFKASEPMELFAVACETAYADSRVNFEVYRLKDNYKDPTDGQLIDSRTAFFEYAGYHRINLNGRFEFDEGEKYSVVVTQQANTENGFTYVFSCNSSRAKEEDPYFPTYAAAVVNPGESYFYTEDARFGKENEWTDWSDEDSYRNTWTKKEAEINNPVVDNFCIKAFADPFVGDWNGEEDDKTVSGN